MPESSPSAVRTSTHATTPCSAPLVFGRPTLSHSAAAPAESIENDMLADEGSVAEEMRRVEDRADAVDVDDEADDIETSASGPVAEEEDDDVSTMPPVGRGTTLLLRRGAVGPDGSSGATCEVDCTEGSGPTTDEWSEVRERGTVPERRVTTGSCAGASGTS